MSHYLLGHCPKLGHRLSALVWETVLSDPFSQDFPTSRLRRHEEFRACWDMVLESLVEGDRFSLECVGMDFHQLMDVVDHDELYDYLTKGLVNKLELVEHGYFSAQLVENVSPCN